MDNWVLYIKFFFSGIHVIQNLNFYVGHDLTQHTQDQHNAYICMLSRGHSMPPSFTSVQEWFHYTLAASDVKGSRQILVVITNDSISL